MALLKVSSRSNPNAVAGAFAGVIREHGCAEVAVVGAGALNQAIKAVAIARNYLTSRGLDLVVVPSFTEVTIDGSPRTGLSLLVETRPVAAPPDDCPEVSVGDDDVAVVHRSPRLPTVVPAQEIAPSRPDARP